MTSIVKIMRQAKKHSLPQRSASVMKAAMGVLLTSAFMLLPTARADETATEKPEAQLSKGELKAQRPKLAAAFDETDTNKDGFVSYEEVRAFAVKYRAERGLDKTKAAAKTPAAAPSPAAAPEPAASQSEAAGAEPESK